MIRLWNRVVIFRALSVLLLLAGAAGGLVLSDRQTQQYRTLTAVDDAAAAPSTIDSDDEIRQIRQGARDSTAEREAAAAAAASAQSEAAARQEAQAKADQAARDAAAQAEKVADEARKSDVANRSKDRTAAPSASVKATVPAVPAGPKVAVPANCSAYSGNRAIGCALVLKAGYGIEQMGCLDKLFNRESGWNTSAHNPSGAYGIPQALPGSKMASVAGDWKTSAQTQITWGLGYIKSRYGSPCAAWGHSQSSGWY